MDRLEPAIEENQNVHFEHDFALTKRRPASSLMRRLQSALMHILLVLLPSPLHALVINDDSPSPNTQGNKTIPETSWLDGLRGIGALIVFTEHFLMPFAPALLEDDDAPSRLDGAQPWVAVMRLPIIRVFYSGSFAVSLFFVVSGFALSCKPLGAKRKLGAHAAMEALGSASLRRGVRLFLPAIAASLMTAVVAVFFGAPLKHGHDSELNLPGDRYDLRMPPAQLASIWERAGDVATYILSQLIYPDKWLRSVPLVSPSVYGFHLWTISVEFWASQLLFMILFATIRLNKVSRVSTILSAALYSLWCLKWEVALFMIGSLLADLYFQRRLGSRPRKNTALATAHPYGLPLANIFMIFCGLWLGTMPDFDGLSTPGYRFLWKLVPEESVWHVIGASMVVFSISQCTIFQALLGMRMMQYLGRISFSLYLVHVPIISAGGWLIVPSLWNYIGKESVIAYGGGVVMGLVLVLAVTLWVADIFWRFIDKASITAAKMLENRWFLDPTDGIR